MMLAQTMISVLLCTTSIAHSRWEAAVHFVVPGTTGWCCVLLSRYSQSEVLYPYLIDTQTSPANRCAGLGVLEWLLVRKAAHRQRGAVQLNSRHSLTREIERSTIPMLALVQRSA